MAAPRPPVQAGLFADPAAEQGLPATSASAHQHPAFSGTEDACEAMFLNPGWVHLFPHFLPETLADELLEQLLAGIPWRQDRLRIMGREIDVPRLQCWMADSSLGYGYSGLRLQPTPWTKPVRTILQAVESITDCRFNSVLLNQYRNGQDSVSWHADDEVELGSNPVIASVSLGACRRFQLKPRQVKPGSDLSRRRIRLELSHGSLLLMGKDIQNNWLHQVPKQPDEIETRVNLTFRQIKTR